MKLMKKKKRENGFTLVEVMVVMVIIGLLTTFVVINVLPAQNKAMVQKAKADIATFEGVIERYRLDMLDYPEESAGLQALVELPAGSRFAERYPEGGYIKRLQTDPWGADYIYKYPGEYGVYDIISYGSDGEPGGEGQAADIINGG